MTETSGHPEWQTILDVLEGLVGKDAPAAVHLKDCDGCRARVREAEGLLARMRSAHLEAVPEAWIEAAMARIAPSRPRALESAWDALVHRLGEGLAVVEAFLAGDSLTPVGALRGYTEASPRMMLYQTDRFAVSLSFSSPAGSMGSNLMGQLSPLEGDRLPGLGRAVLLSEDISAETALNELGEFSFDDLPSGPLQLAVKIGPQLIRVGPFGRTAGIA